MQVNGETVTELGSKGDPEVDEIRCDGTVIKPQTEVYYLVNKPTGFVCSNAPEKQLPRVIDLVPDTRQLHTVGRLDVPSQGLILLTNDGELTQKLTHPKYGVQKTYRVITTGRITDDEMRLLRKTTHLAEGPARPDRVKVVHRDPNRSTLEFVLSEGKNREIRRILARLHKKVKQLKRIRFGPLSLKGLPLGGFRKLTPEEVRELEDSVGKPTPRRGRKRPPISEGKLTRKIHELKDRNRRSKGRRGGPPSGGGSSKGNRS